jgi:hypothetical protein
MPMMTTTVVAAELIWRTSPATPVENRVGGQETARVINNNIFQQKEREL